MRSGDATRNARTVTLSGASRLTIEGAFCACASDAHPSATTSRQSLFRVVADAKFLQGFFRTAIPARHRSIAGVLQIVDAHSRGPETARGEIAEIGEER